MVFLGASLSMSGCAAGGGAEETIIDPEDAGLDSSAGSGGGASDDDASIDGGDGGSGGQDGGDDGGLDGGSDGDAAPTDGGDESDGGSDADAEPPKGTLELCVLNTGGPLDLCETPEELDYGIVNAGTQEMRLFRLDNETLEEVVFETVHVASPDFSVVTVRYVHDPDDPATLAREVVTLPATRPAGTALYFEVTFTSKGETAGPVPADKVYVTATTASDDIIDIEVPIVGEQKACDEGFAACDADPKNGCDTNIKEALDHCGACGTRCEYANGVGACDDGVCKLTACSADFADCNNDLSDGCETNLKVDSNHCGTCDNVCDLANADSACSGGSCVIVACTDPFLSCDNNPATGCEVDTSTDLAHCGGCNKKCDYANASERCQGGNCIFEGCNSGYANCNGDLADGCEIRTDTNLSHCGGCNQVCGYPNASASCQSGICQFGSCNTDYADCNGNRSDGCEANLRTDIANCGACGNACSFPNGVGACVNGTCQLVECNVGFGNCDGNPVTGCETNLTANGSHCGVCNNKCSYPNAAATCQASTCTMGACQAGFADCNLNPADGCEKNILTDSNNCGTCGNVCPSGRVCMEGQCRIPCGTGLLECDNACRDISNDRNHCGGCNIRCNDNQTCTGGVCQNCPSGQLSCGSFCVNATSNTCSAPISAGTLSAGGRYTSTERYLRGNGHVEWFRVDFPMNASPRQRGTGTPKIEFLFNENNVFQIDVFSDCGTTPFACGNESGSSTNRTGFTFVDNYSDTGLGFTSRVRPWPSTVYVRVKRNGGTGCERYQLQISR